MCDRFFLFLEYEILKWLYIQLAKCMSFNQVPGTSGAVLAGFDILLILSAQSVKGISV